MVKKNLVFHFYIPDEYKDNIMVRLHLECFKRYSYIFDTATFIMIGREDNVRQAKKDILDCGFRGDVRFIDRENDLYFDSRTFKDFVIDKLNEYDGITFFGHLKGIRNISMFPEITENILKWVYGMYFYSLEFMSEVEIKLVTAYMGNYAYFFGPFLAVNDDGTGRMHYQGTFYWLNTKAIYNYERSGRVVFPEFADRFYAELFTNWFPNSMLESRMQIRMEQNDLYHGDIDSIISYYGDYEQFMKNYNEIRAKI